MAELQSAYKNIDTASRVFLQNIPTGVSEERLKKSLNSYGEVEVHVFVPGIANNGWAWVGFTQREAADKLIFGEANTPDVSPAKAPSDCPPPDVEKEVLPASVDAEATDECSSTS